MLKRKLLELIKAKSLDEKEIEPSDLIFEERVKLQCFHCPKYGVNWSCPPNIPALGYQKIILEYNNLLLVFCKMPFTEGRFDRIRRESSNLLHRTLLAAEEFLWENNHPLGISFIGGSCKLCVEGCDPHGCRQPTLVRIPIEATGINVVKSAENVGLQINFPPKGYLYRVGLLGW